MSTLATPSPMVADAWSQFDTTTSRWGRITMIAALCLMLAGPLVLSIQLGVDPGDVAAGVVAIALVFGILWFVEPFSYFPILGAASMYQAFMIGNISNKLVPAAIVAQSTIGAKPGTKRGQLAAVLAICGAATTHLLSLAVFVGVLGNLLLNAFPPELVAQVQTFVLPAVMGAVVVQMIASNPNTRILAIAIVVGLVVQLLLTPLFPVMAYFGIAVSVVATILLALFLPGRTKADPDTADPSAADPS
ncbi:hypothetical protein SAMN05428985_101626 [Nocardioides sp. YR527]|uniref:hypothetical protein n=1 Tax=Nocardioides sp. YR527 TaxID=1881028 RepID=UPI0008839C26|nr:hypothetical protein [Nocardioides sp. YR527]SDJ82602.1 hypothetical protein SAMN05428985_101626 [Nocardioides sp. YR527]